MTELERAVAFEESLREAVADRIVPFAFGDAVFAHSLPLVWELNVLRVRRTGAEAGRLARYADQLQGEAGLEHRRVVVLDEAEGARLAAGFRALGWETGRFLFMAHRREPERTVDLRVVREVDRDVLAPLREAAARREPWAADERALRQVLRANELASAAGRARHFAVLADDLVASCADLYSDGSTAQIEEVVTDPRFRGRGFASAVVLAALAAARSARHDLVFLTADDDDWPKELYRRLGFDPLGAKHAFLRPPQDAKRRAARDR